MGAAEMAKLIGKKGEYTPTNGGIAFLVVIRDVKERFGRVDVLVEPAKGTGAAWVRLDSVTIPPKNP